MANYTYFYTIGFYDKEGNGVDRDIVSFLDKIEARIREDDVRIVRSINKEFLRMFLFLRDLMNDDIVVVPLGKLMDKEIDEENKWKNEIVKKIAIIQSDMQEIVKEIKKSK